MNPVKRNFSGNFFRSFLHFFNPAFALLSIVLAGNQGLLEYPLSSILNRANTSDTIGLQHREKPGNYIPFYFGARMPMLYVIQKGYNDVPVTPAKDIVWCISSVQKIVDHNLPFVFFNGHTVDGLSDFYEQKDLLNIDTILDKKAIDATYWRKDGDLDLKRRKEAEFLVETDIPTAAIIGWVVFNEEAKNRFRNGGFLSVGRWKNNYQFSYKNRLA